MKWNYLIAGAIFSSLLISGCQSFNKNDVKFKTEQSRLNDDLIKIRAERIKNPDDPIIKSREQQEINRLVDFDLKKADYFWTEELYDQAITHWKAVLVLQPGNLRALQGIKQVDNKKALLLILTEAENIAQNQPEEALKCVNILLEESPAWEDAKRLSDRLQRELSMQPGAENRLSDDLRKPISINFRSHNLIQILDVIATKTGINFIYDNDVSPEATASIVAKDTNAEDVINLLLASNQLQKKILAGNTLLIYPSTSSKEKDYREVQVKSFFLKYVQAKVINVAIRNMVKIKDIYVDERTNSLILRAPNETIALAEKLLAMLDRPESEVTLEVEVLEVNSRDLEQVGINYPGNIAVGVVAKDENIPMKEFLNLGKGNSFINLGKGRGFSLDLSQLKSNSKVLANPRIRVRNNKKASIDISERIPVLTSFVLDSGATSEKVEYQQVGLKLEVTPDISHEGEIAMEVDFSLSSLGSAEESKDKVKYYRTKERAAKTVLSGKNHETQILAGLINHEQKNSRSGLPWLSQLPIVGKLFGSDSDSLERTEVVLLITPHIERYLDLPGGYINQFSYGTESHVGGQHLKLDKPGGLKVSSRPIPVLDSTRPDEDRNDDAEDAE